MDSDNDTRTSSSLLLQLKDLSNTRAWEEFVARYAPRIFGWCRRHGLQESDASDITQEVLGKLVKAMQTFQYNASRGRFRSWLKTVTNNAVRDFARELTGPGRGSGGTTVQRNLSAIQDPQTLQELKDTIRAEVERELLLAAEERVQRRVQEHTWQAYRLTANNRLTASEAAQQLQLTVSDIYVAKSRVIKMLRAEIEDLDQSPLSVPDQ